MNETEAAALTELARFRALRAESCVALRDALCNEWLWLVRYIVSARRYHAPGWEYNDFVSEGTIGLLTAIDAYDPDGKHDGLRFHTVADFAIRGHLRAAIQQDIADQPTVPLRVFDGVLTDAWLQDRITRELPALGPSVEEQVMATVDGMAVSATLEAALLLLPERQLEIITKLFCLGGDQHIWTMEEVGRSLGIHKSNVCRAQQKALGSLRAHLSQTQDGALVLRELNQRQQQTKRRAAA